MKKSRPDGYYTLVAETPDRLVFTRTRRQRVRAAIVLAIASLILLSTAVYSFSRQPRDMAGFVFFLLAGTGVAGLSVYFYSSWTEIEFNRQARQIIKRKHALGQARAIETLPFSQLKRVSVSKTLGEYADAYHIRLIVHADVAWATLPGYMVENHASMMRQKIMGFLSELQSN